MKKLMLVALTSVGALCLLNSMPAQAAGGGSGGHNASSGPHAAQNQPMAAKSQTAKTKDKKETYLKYELKDATVTSAAKAKKGKTTNGFTIKKTTDKASTKLMQ